MTPQAHSRSGFAILRPGWRVLVSTALHLSCGPLQIFWGSQRRKAGNKAQFTPRGVRVPPGRILATPDDQFDHLPDPHIDFARLRCREGRAHAAACCAGASITISLGRTAPSVASDILTAKGSEG